MAAYYNENEPYAATWLRNLIVAGHIAPGDVDERSIADVMPSDLIGYTQCHFFAGIGGWSIALRLAEWPDDQPVWTGSCPCQPFSGAGKRSGAADERHLWPHWFRLIRECKPAVLFGEQVDAAVRWGWLDAVCADLESEGYAAGAAVLPACGVGAPHIRQRVWFVADASRGGWTDERGSDGQAGQHVGALVGANRGNDSGHHPEGDRAIAARDAGEIGVCGVADADTAGRGEQRSGGLLDGERPAQRDDADGCGIVGDADVPRSQGRRIDQDGAGQWSAGPAGMAGFWSACERLACTDGKARPTQPGLHPLAHGIQRRSSKLRAYGNAIVPQVAARFIEAYQTRNKG